MIVILTDMIDLNCLLPEDAKFTPLFDNDAEYQEFRERYIESMKPYLDDNALRHRRSEDEATRRMV